MTVFLERDVEARDKIPELRHTHEALYSTDALSKSAKADVATRQNTKETLTSLSRQNILRQAMGNFFSRKNAGKLPADEEEGPQTNRDLDHDPQSQRFTGGQYEMNQIGDPSKRPRMTPDATHNIEPSAAGTVEQQTRTQIQQTSPIRRTQTRKHLLTSPSFSPHLIDVFKRILYICFAIRQVLLQDSSQPRPLFKYIEQQSSDVCSGLIQIGQVMVLYGGQAQVQTILGPAVTSEGVLIMLLDRLSQGVCGTGTMDFLDVYQYVIDNLVSRTIHFRISHEAD